MFSFVSENKCKFTIFLTNFNVFYCGNIIIFFDFPTYLSSFALISTLPA